MFIFPSNTERGSLSAVVSRLLESGHVLINVVIRVEVDLNYFLVSFFDVVSDLVHGYLLENGSAALLALRLEAVLHLLIIFAVGMEYLLGWESIFGGHCSYFGHLDVG